MERNNKNDYSIEDIEQKIKELEGLKRHEFIEQIVEEMKKYEYDKEDIEQKIKELKRFEGHEYSEKDIEQKIEELKRIIEISEKSPKTFSLDMENIRQKIKEMKASKEEIMKILEQQRYIAQQEKEISELARRKDEHE